ncbi:hypothetical protein JKF63_01887 [Porcisia hertigi]|uniref:Uncharacterized protein n=1 Tax=Porcisia hertigi TaxID=2761500 RepID=A0A836IGL1_9TRYP|nr:hypothetical protein JKF63_01887 [Porcisia hertigi]
MSLSWCRVDLSRHHIGGLHRRRRCAAVHVHNCQNVSPLIGAQVRGHIILGERTGSSDGSNAQETFKLYMKGADEKMASVLRQSDWLGECCQELAQMGLRTLGFAGRTPSEDILRTFLHQYEAAMSILGNDRAEAIETAMRALERDTTLIGVTGGGGKMSCKMMP